MEVDRNFSSLLRNLKMDDPWNPPKTWESIPSESGAARSGDSGRGPQDPVYDPSSVSDAVLVRLVTNALQGVRSALAEIEKLSAAFCSSPADRTIHRVPSLWCRSLSTNALGKILKSIYRSGLLVFFLQKFINFYLCEGQAVMTENRDKEEEVEDLNNPKFAESLLRPLSKEVHHKNELGMYPPYSLVNQAFSVAVKKVLEGYFCAFDTLLASVKLRHANPCAKFSDGTVNLMTAVHSEITVLEVYLHTKELRTHIESLGNICFPKFADLGLSRKDLTVDAQLEFHNFPRGADLLTYLYVQLRVIPFASTPNLLGKRRDVNDLIFLASDEDFLFSGTADEESAANLPSVQRDKDASYTSEDSSYELEPLQSSECSSSYSSVEENETEVFFRLHDGVLQPEHFLLSNLSTCCTTESVLENSFETERPYFQISFQNNRRTVPSFPLSNRAYKDEKLIQIPVSIQSGNIRSAKMSDSVYEAYHSGRCWPLGGLSKNPFYNYRNCMDRKEPHFTENSLQMTDGNTETPEREESVFGEVSIPLNSRSDTDKKVEFMNHRNGHLSSHIQKLWNSSDYYDLSINPMVTKAAGLWKKAHYSRNGIFTKKEGSDLPYFDFSSVIVPCKASAGSVFSSSGHGFQVEAPVVNSGVSSVQVNGNSEGNMQDNMANLSVSSPVCSLSEGNHISGILSQSASGGAAWAQSLQYPSESAMLSSREILDGSSIFEMPLYVTIDKWMLQEILLQYKYVSNFTLKLLDEGFDLHEHLLALRRYHFMELADWADSFLMSLRNQKWSVVEPEQKIAEIQGLLELALQRSSCETDQYKERLFVYIKGQNTMHLSASITGIHAFDFILLGYRVDWPVSIIVTQDALKIYAEIFGYLVQVRRAVFSLTDVWYCLKALMRSICRGRHKNSHVMLDFNILMKMRQQINHFVSTLQQYVHSQLSDVSWCQFQHSLKHQVNDVLDLESVHMSYLADALHICFLSVETKPVALIIKNILQCALDFRHCFTGGDLDDATNEADPLNLRSQINFSQVFVIKTTFEKNIKDLYLLYLKSPKHGEFNFCHFWGYLNYNDYYSNIFNKEMGYFYM
ncbi:uncharacterized protein LOC103722329 isoform X3 [Phoenix dactylifera]|uniref:Gamma-tubulin complex component n=1 Tax=Phoenix dactylifera TaxID=42345 RepID=A0A8B9AUA2_PHODC|nr:uncharacterized protein LOC103722329 isoform X3 [Phoenix dactylifera]